MAGATPDELAALGEELLAGMARLRETVDAMGRSLSVLKRTTAELRQDVTRRAERALGLDRPADRNKARLDAPAVRKLSKRDIGEWLKMTHRAAS